MIDQEEKSPQVSSVNSLEKTTPKDTFEGYKHTLINRLYAVLCIREKNGEWEKYVNSILVELIGYDSDSITYWKLRGCIGALKLLTYSHFRKTIFDCIRLIEDLTIDELS